MLLPVGHYQKSSIREIATQLGLNVADKKDSQEICFVTSGHHGQFVRDRQGDIDTAGEIVTTDGTVVGTHSGIESFTIGQRKGLGVALGEPHYVVRIDAANQQVVLGRLAELGRQELTACNTNWLTQPLVDADGAFRCAAQIRYNSQPEPAQAWITKQGLRVVFDKPQNGVAPGQAVVCYEADRVLGGGWIES
jgi:tRNA-specific 2-thiouridylase